LPTGAICVCLLANWQKLYQISGQSQEKFAAKGTKTQKINHAWTHINTEIFAVEKV
jgi:hypothetical protein